MQQKHIDNDWYSGDRNHEVQVKHVPYFTARSVCTGPLRETRATAVLPVRREGRADRVVNRLFVVRATEQH